MPIPEIFKSKAFWTFSFFTGSVTSCVAYDRYHSHLLRQFYLSEASQYGRQPLPHHHSPRCISIFLLAKDPVQHKSIRDTFKSFALEILTTAGVDYKWMVEVDGVEAGKWWDEAAREGNKPELMLDENTGKEKSIKIEALRERVLTHLLTKRSGITANVVDDASEPLWQSIRTKSCRTDWPPSSDGFLALDHFTYNSLQTDLQKLANASTNSSHTTADVKKSSWFWSKKPQTTHSQSQPPLFPVPLYFIPCDYPQTLSTRFIRFLFGQRHLTRSIGDSLLALIREQPNSLIARIDDDKQ